ncbi:PP-loop family protein [Peptoniphilus duerdenii ATCC BAA-1640]|uniref:PP-loop family protein n=2 Tax=Peptoniphilaceae TaxID=1570339 RepID=E0NJU2_9FIRM|nr:PP-loop family protein [Peptoniphilus duerdenii ATCC BAA-1640]
MGEKMVKSQLEIERSLIKTYKKRIWTKFIRAIKEYELVEKGDKIAVAISGGKDSLTLAKLFQELKKHKKFDFDLEFIAMDPGYKKEKLDQMLYNCEKLGIPVKVHQSDIFEVSERIAGENPCYMCARMRRGNLYAKAQELGCNKLALGHHFDDVIETVMLNIIFAGDFKTMMPKLKAQNFENMELIRPMYLIEEESIIRFMKSTGLTAMDCACTVTSKKSGGSKRDYVKQLIKELKKENEVVGINIMRATENVNMGAILGFKDNLGKHSFLERYDD